MDHVVQQDIGGSHHDNGFPPQANGMVEQLRHQLKDALCTRGAATVGRSLAVGHLRLRAAPQG